MLPRDNLVLRRAGEGRRGLDTPRRSKHGHFISSNVTNRPRGVNTRRRAIIINGSLFSFPLYFNFNAVFETFTARRIELDDETQIVLAS